MIQLPGVFLGATSTTSGPVMARTVWGSGPRVVLVHGGGAGGSAAFSQQQPLSDSYQLVLPDRPGAGLTPADGAQDANRDGALVADLLADGAHLVGHSYGAVVAMVAAARAPSSVRSLVLIEPPAFQLAADNPVVAEYWQEMQSAVSQADPVRRVQAFFRSAGIPGDVPDELPPGLRHLAADLATMRQPWDVPLDLATLRRLGVPTVVVSGGHREAFEHLTDRLAGLLDAEHVVLAGAGHAVQDTGEPFNDLLRRVWASSGPLAEVLSMS